MKKLAKILALCLTGALLLTACGGRAGSGQESSNSSEEVLTEVSESVENAADSTLEATNESESMEESAMAETEKNVTELDPDKPMIALTFDDGPNQVTTPQVLDLLEEYGITASFFLIGDNITISTKSVVERAYNMGCEINNHSKTHSNMTTLTAEEIQAEIEYTSNMIENITGEAPKFFRPPYIAVNDTMYDNIDLTFICGHGCTDWEDSVTAEQRAEKVLDFADDGVIILMHDFSYNSQTVEALKTIIPTLLEEGYQFVTVGQLFEAKGITLSADDKNMYTVVE